MTATTNAPCALGTSTAHHPVPLYAELHHLVPRAWQAAWTPPQAPAPGVYAGQPLWDARTVALCRTHHGNVHFLLVEMLHVYASGSLPAVGDQIAIEKAWRQARRAWPGHSLEWTTALLGAQRFLEAGGDPNFLVAHDLWGEI